MPVPQPAPTTTPASGFDAAHAHDILRELMDHGAELVRALVLQARAEPVPHPFWGDKAPVDHPTEHIARCYDRITRSIRRTIALARHLDDPIRPRPMVERSAPKAANDTATGCFDDRANERANDRERDLGTTADRPDEPDWEEDHTQDLARPLAEVVTELGTDLGLTPGAPSKRASHPHQPTRLHPANSAQPPPIPRPTPRKPSG